MNKIAFVIIALTSMLTQAHDLAGTWTGKGAWHMGSVRKSYEIEVSLDVKVTDTQIILKDCWQPVPVGKQSKNLCYDTVYDVKEGRAYFEGNWVGYLLPFQLTAFYGNSQVSEQIIVTKVSDNKIEFLYSYANFDGDSHYRVEELTKVP